MDDEVGNAVTGGTVTKLLEVVTMRVMPTAVEDTGDVFIVLETTELDLDCDGIAMVMDEDLIDADLRLVGGAVSVLVRIVVV